MKVTNSRFFLGALIVSAIGGLGACELVASVDRTKIPAEAVVTDGGKEGSADVTQPDVTTDKPVADTTPEVGKEAEASTASCTNGEKDGDETDKDCGGSCTTKCSVDQGCNIDGDCDPATSGKCTGKKCAAPSCSDDVKNGQETDKDCGGTCTQKCGPGQGCNGPGDCTTGVCNATSKKCDQSSCTDKTKNGDETDTDCGGSCTTKCSDDKGCAADKDCMNGNCDTAATPPKCRPATCEDNKKDGNETDKDCGGSCQNKCAVGQGCLQGSDCVEGVCDTTATPPVCKAAACDDTIKNGNETDTDCGGSCATATTPKKCADTKGCLVPADCESGFCNTSGTPPLNKCEAAGCNDGNLNGTETDVDCGGGGCKACEDNKACKQASDCVSLHCAAGSDGGLICIAPTCTDGIQNQGETDVDCGGELGDGGTNGCQRCADGKHCVGSEDCLTNHACDPASNNTCVECLANSNCPLGKLCNTTLKTCSVNGCVSGQHECPTPESCCSGTCANTQTDPNNCNACGTVCSNSHVPVPACAAGVCSGACETGYDDCNTNKQLDGCEASVVADIANCGGCNKACSNTHVPTPLCANGVCTGACETGWSDCDNNKQGTGCEANVQTDTANCGACLRPCSSTGVATATCAAGVCTSTCAAGFGNCNQPAAPTADDGCETDTGTSAANCGACGRACSNTNVATAACAGGVCTSTCATGFGNCTQPAAPALDDGCETGTASSTTHCGACNRACSTAHVDTATCAAGVCTSTCVTGYGNCGQPAAPTADDGCEINIQIDEAHCGQCNRACSTTNVASATCAAGLCNSTCQAGWGNCDQPAAPTNDNGCETDTNGDEDHCGACNRACSSTGVNTRLCALGLCTSTCTGTNANCVQPPASTVDDGCEVTDLATDAFNCGVCGHVCGNGGTCVGGLCNCGGTACTLVTEVCTGATTCG